MTEQLHLNTLESFRHPHHPFLYLVDDEMAVKGIVQSLPHSYGLEVGFGKEPTSVFNIDTTLPWILTESDTLRFTHFKQDSLHHWLDIKSEATSIDQPILALKTIATEKMQHDAHIVVYRNINYQEMQMVSFEDLRPDQRIVFIVDMDHIPEVPAYGSFLWEHGYDARQLKRRPQDLPQFTYPYPFSPNDYVFDVTKEA